MTYMVCILTSQFKIAKCTKSQASRNRYLSVLEDNNLIYSNINVMANLVITFLIYRDEILKYHNMHKIILVYQKPHGIRNALN